MSRRYRTRNTNTIARFHGGQMQNSSRDNSVPGNGDGLRSIKDIIASQCDGRVFRDRAPVCIRAKRRVYDVIVYEQIHMYTDINLSDHCFHRHFRWSGLRWGGVSVLVVTTIILSVSVSLSIS